MYVSSKYECTIVIVTAQSAGAAASIQSVSDGQHSKDQLTGWESVIQSILIIQLPLATWWTFPSAAMDPSK